MPNSRGAVVRWLERLGYGAGKTPEGREFEAGFRYPTTEKLSMPTQQLMGTFFESEKDKAAKGERWALPFICCAKDSPQCPYGYWAMGNLYIHLLCRKQKNKKL